ncbi:MAG: hypothetical protein IRY87_09270 [Acetobacteraceae bacterium]|nr:hypothetical protein [Acetobacteraceae bacterium]
MYAMIRRYVGSGSVAEEVGRRATQGLVPSLRQSPGFAGLCAVSSEDGDIYSISFFDTRQNAEASHARVREWVQGNLRDLLPNPPEVMSGEVRTNEMAQVQGSEGGQAFVTMRIFDGARGAIPDIAQRAKEVLIPLMRQQNGFRGSISFSTDQSPSRIVAISFWQNQEAGQAGTEQILATIAAKMRDLLPNPPKRVAGPAMMMVMTPAPQRGPSA